MDDTKTLSIPAPGGTKLRATPFTDDQLIAFSMIRGADSSLTMEILATLFRHAFGADTYREFALRMASGDTTATLKTMIELLGSVATSSKSETVETVDGTAAAVFRGDV